MASRCPTTRDTGWTWRCDPGYGAGGGDTVRALSFGSDIECPFDIAGVPLRLAFAVCSHYGSRRNASRAYAETPGGHMTNAQQSATPGTTTFWHLSDLHLEMPHEPRCAKTESACPACIKAALIERLASRLRKEPPHLLLFGGDIFDDDCFKADAHPLKPLLDAAKDSKTVLVGVRGQHDRPTHELRERFTWVLKAGEANEDTAVFVQGLPASETGSGAPERTAETLRQLADARRHPNRPSVLLAHVNLDQFPRSDRGEGRFHYYAIGDKHLSRIVTLGDRSVVGNPGHLYSYFDGSGKAWPTFLLSGQITEAGDVDVDRVPLQGGDLAPPTRQLYVHHRHRKTDDGELVLVNAPPEETLRDAGLQQWAVRELQPTCRDDRDISLRQVTVRYADRRTLELLVRRMLKVMPDDVFVGLSKGTGRAADRETAYGSQLHGDVAAFVERLFMANANTATSDDEGWRAPDGPVLTDRPRADID